MKDIISIEKEHMDVPIWVKDNEGVFLPAEKDHRVFTLLKESDLNKLEKFSKRWEDTHLAIEKESNNDSEIMKDLNRKASSLENESKQLATILKEKHGDIFDFCYWSDSKLKRIMI